MAIPAGIIIMWDGTHGNIPTGWDREQLLDDLFIKGWPNNSTNPSVTGGGATHVHPNDSSNHTHTVAAHGHSAVSPSPSLNLRGNNYFDGEYGAIMQNNHTHSFSSTNNVTGGASSNASATSTWDSQTSEAHHFEPIFIKSDGTPSGFPQDSQVFSAVSTLPTGWAQHTASRGLFLKGAPTGSGNGGGGSNTAGTHAHTGTVHTHTTVDHTPGASNVTGGGNWPNWSSTSTYTNSPYVPQNLRQSGFTSHTHSTSFTAAASGTSNNVGDVSADATNNPPYHTLWMLDNQSAGEDYPELEGIIVMWLGSLTDDVVTTDGWELCDGTDNGWGTSTNTPELRGKYIKLATSSGQIGDEDGSVAHGHSAGGHTHTTGGHTHPANLGGSPSLPWNNQKIITNNVNGNYNAVNHTHPPAVTSASASPNLESGGAAAANQTSAEPSHRTIAFLHMPEAVEAGGNLGIFGANF